MEGNFVGFHYLNWNGKIIAVFIKVIKEENLQERDIGMNF